jgi:hypothetical protein
MVIATWFLAMCTNIYMYQLGLTHSQIIILYNFYMNQIVIRIVPQNHLRGAAKPCSYYCQLLYAWSLFVRLSCDFLFFFPLHFLNKLTNL